MATTADILGFNRRSAIPGHWTGHYERLCTEQDRLLARDCSAPQSSSTKLDELADAGSEETLRDISLVSAELTNTTIQEVLEAIRRIERGNYGTCEITGQPIEAERLKAIPWTRYSYAGQDELERGGYSRRPGLPALHPVSQPDAMAEGEEEKEKEKAA